MSKKTILSKTILNWHDDIIILKIHKLVIHKFVKLCFFATIKAHKEVNDHYAGTCHDYRCFSTTGCWSCRRLSSPSAPSLSVILLNNHNPRISGSPRTCRITNMAERQSKPDKCIYIHILLWVVHDVLSTRPKVIFRSFLSQFWGVKWLGNGRKVTLLRVKDDFGATRKWHTYKT